jgi:hypothetical protein
VNTDVGKIFSVIFALVGIPLMFITAADIGKFLSDTLLRIISEWKMMIRRVKASKSLLGKRECVIHARHVQRFVSYLLCMHKDGKYRRKSMQSMMSVSMAGALELADIDCEFE